MTDTHHKQDTKDQPFAVTPPYDRLLRGDDGMPIGLHQLHTATASQLCRLHYAAGSRKHVQALLRVLVDNGYVQADWTPTRQLRSPYHYVLGSKGIDYLRQAGLDVPDALRASKETDKQYLFIQHTLELNDVLIAAALLKRADPRYCLERFIHERTLKRSPYRATWETRKGTTYQMETATLIPDAFLDFRLMTPTGTRRLPVLLEHDRGTEEQQHFRRRVRAYIAMLKSQGYTEWLGIKAITIAFTTFKGEQRVSQMREWTRQELAATNEPKSIGLAFCFTALDQTSLIGPDGPSRLWLSPCFHTAYEQDQPLALLAGE